MSSHELTRTGARCVGRAMRARWIAQSVACRSKPMDATTESLYMIHVRLFYNKVQQQRWILANQHQHQPSRTISHPPPLPHVVHVDATQSCAINVQEA